MSIASEFRKHGIHAANHEQELLIPVKKGKNESQKGKKEKFVEVKIAAQGGTFNAGVLYMNLDLWRKDSIGACVEQINGINKKEKFYKDLGSQMPLNILFGGTRFLRLGPLNEYAIDLGSPAGRTYSKEELSAVKFMHWSGAHKPWLSSRKAFHVDLWEKYSL